MTLGHSNLASLLLERAAATPAAVALYATEQGRERVVSYADLTDQSARGAGLLRSLGIRTGDHVLIFQPVSVDLYVVLLAIFRVGATAMFVDPSAGRSHLEHCCRLIQPRAMVGPARAHLLRLISKALWRIERPIVTRGWWPGMGTVRWPSLRVRLPDPEIAAVSADAAALITFTSGSTGAPKAAVRTHGFLRAQHRALEDSLSLRAGETDLATLPVFVLANLASGVASILPDADLRQPGHVQTAAIARQVARLRPTRTAASPALLERLLEKGVAMDEFRKIYTGGAPVFPDLLARLCIAAPGAEIAAIYGSTEAEPMAHLRAEDISTDDLAAMRAGAGLLAGLPVPSVRLRVIDDRWGTPPGNLTADAFAGMGCSPGAAGEIVVTGEHVLKGYLRGTGDEETKFQVEGERWHRTGDAGRLDERGRLWLLGRCAAKIPDAGGVQYPLAVECAARLSVPSIRRCAFVAVRGRRWLLIAAARSLREDELETAKASLAWAMVERVRQVRCIPMDRRHNAKIDYPKLSKIVDGMR